TFFGYGGQSNIPVPDDYDGDGMIDLAVKSDTQGSWNIDYASNGFGSWDATYFGYGGSDNRPGASDYDGDGKADLSVKASSSGKWNIDYAANGFGSWDVSLNGYGGSQNIPGPAHYHGGRKNDPCCWGVSWWWNLRHRFCLQWVWHLGYSAPEPASIRRPSGSGRFQWR